MRPSTPLFNVPRAVVGAVAVLVLAAILINLVLSQSLRREVLQSLVYAPLLSMMGFKVWLAEVYRLVTYGLVHTDVMHIAVNALWLLVFGTPVCRRMGDARFVILLIAGFIAGALLWDVMTSRPGFLLGASAGVAAMMGAVVRMGFSSGFDRQPLRSWSAVASDQQTLMFVGIWFMMEFAFHGLGLLSGQGQVAWQAHLGGFMAGLLLTGPLMSTNKPTTRSKRNSHLKIVD